MPKQKAKQKGYRKCFAVDIGERLKIVRNKESREVFAAKIGIHPQSLYRYEQGGRSVDSSVIYAVCSEYEISSDWLIFGTGPMRRTDGPQPASALNQPPQAPPEAAEQCPACSRCAKLEQRLEASEEERREITQENRKLWQEIATIREKLARMDEYQKMCKHMQDGTTDSYVA